MIDVNTTSKTPTHFLRGVELVKRGRREFDIQSENWPYPTTIRFGFPQDRYYAEIWHDGMDWNSNYWVIEECHYEKPQIQPLILFDECSEREKFNDYDFGNLVEACLFFRRDALWIMSGDLGVATDLVWPFYCNTGEVKNEILWKSWFEHASQPPVNFWINYNFVPRAYWNIRRPNEKDWNCGNKETGHPKSLQVGGRKVF